MAAILVWYVWGEDTTPVSATAAILVLAILAAELFIFLADAPF